MEPNEEPRRASRLERRSILKLMTTVPAGVVFSRGRYAVAAQSAPQIAPPRVLNAHEWKTLHVLCDLVIPADERSGGAVAAGVPEFIDDWLDFQRGSLLDQIRGGFTWLDLQCNRAFRHDFADCAAGQQKQMLDRIAYPGKAAPQDLGAVAFFNRFRDLVVTGFFTSEMGIADLPYLGNEPQSEWKGCPDTVLAKLGLG